MNEVFVSYKREDEPRVGRLVRALEDAGFSVWWDRGLGGGESWRAQIQTALDAAKCVLVVWTQIDRARALSRHPEPTERRRALQILEGVSSRARSLGMEGAIEHARRSFAASL